MLHDITVYMETSELFKQVSNEIYKSIYRNYVEECESPELMKAVLSLMFLSRLGKIEGLQEKIISAVEKSEIRLSDTDMRRICIEYYLGLPRSHEEFALADRFRFELKKANV